MPSREVEVNLNSAKDLKRGKLFGKQSPAALVSVSGSSQRQASRACTKGNADPVWNEQFIFTVDESVLLGRSPTVTIQIFSSSNFHESPLGTAYVSLTSAVNKTGELQFGDHRVYRPSGRVQGHVNASVKVTGPKFSSEQLESSKNANQAQHQPPPQPYGMSGYGAPSAQYSPYGSAYGYPQGPPPPQYYQPGYGQQPQVVYVQRNGGGYGGGYGGYGGGSRFGGGRMGGGGMGGAGMGMGAGLLMGGLGGLALGEALDNDCGGCGGGGCGGGGCGGGGCGG